MNLSTNLATIILPTLRARIDGRKPFIFGGVFLNVENRELVEGGKIGRNEFVNVSKAITPFSTILLSKDKKKKLGKTVKGWVIRARERERRKLVERFSGGAFEDQP